MTPWANATPSEFVRFLDERLATSRSTREALSGFQPQLSYGRHAGPAPDYAPRAAVAILLYPHQDQWRLPLTRRPRHMKNHGGQICLPGGAVDSGETPSEAARRELHEELAVAPSEVAVHGQLAPLFVYGSGFLIHPVVMTAQQRPKMVPSPAEVEELLEAPLDELLAPRCRSSVVHRRRGIEFASPCYRWRSHVVWGATSMLLAEFLSLLVDGEPRDERALPNQSTRS